MIGGIDDYIDPVDIEVGDEVNEDEIVAIAEEQNLLVQNCGNEVKLLDSNDKVIYRFIYVGVKFFGPTYVLTTQVEAKDERA